MKTRISEIKSPWDWMISRMEMRGESGRLRINISTKLIQSEGDWGKREKEQSLWTLLKDRYQKI